MGPWALQEGVHTGEPRLRDWRSPWARASDSSGGATPTRGGARREGGGGGGGGRVLAQPASCPVCVDREAEEARAAAGLCVGRGDSSSCPSAFLARVGVGGGASLLIVAASVVAQAPQLRFLRKGSSSILLKGGCPVRHYGVAQRRHQRFSPTRAFERLVSHTQACGSMQFPLMFGPSRRTACTCTILILCLALVFTLRMLCGHAPLGLERASASWICFCRDAFVRGFLCALGRWKLCSDVAGSSEHEGWQWSET